MKFHYETKNKSFTKLVEEMKKKDIDVRFILRLNDVTLTGVDPHDPSLDEATRNKVIEEVNTNFWYFVREVVTLPLLLSNETKKIKAHKGNIAFWKLALHNFNVYMELPRHTGSAITATIYILWKELSGRNSLYSFGSESINTSINHLNRLVQMYNALPWYIIKHKKLFSVTPALYENESRGNHLFTDFIGTDLSSYAATQQAMDNKADVKWLDGFTHLKYNEATLNGYLKDVKHQTIITSPIGFDNDPRDVAAQKLILSSLEFEDTMYNSLPLDRLKEKVDDTVSGMIYITYGPIELGLTEKYLAEQMRYICGDLHTFTREIMMQRPSESLINVIKHLRAQNVSEDAIERITAQYVQSKEMKDHD